MQSLEGLLFTGGAIRALTPDQVASIGDFASRMFGVEVRQVHNVAQELGVDHTEIEHQEEPVVLDRDHLRKWVRRHGYSEGKWRKVCVTIETSEAWGTGRDGAESLDPHPDIVIIDPEYDIDLRSVYRRLARTQMSTRAWRTPGLEYPTQEVVKIMVEYVNDQLQPEEPLNFHEAQETPYPWLR